jgi:hypothetical protein
MTLTLRERCCKRLAGLKSMRTPYEADAMEIARLAAPARSRFNNSDTNKNKRMTNKALFSSHGITAFRTLTGGMTSGLTSSSRPWFMLAMHDDELMEQPEVREWLTIVTKRMYDFLAGTNFYGAAKTGYSELGLFGIEACVMVENPEFGLVYHPLTFGEYWIALSSANVVDTLYRRVPMTTVQAVQHFGLDAVSSRVRTAYDTSNYETTVDVMHAIQPNLDRQPDRLDHAGKRYQSIYWDEANDSVSAGEYGGLLRLQGYEEKPFWCARWDTTGSDAWGTGPGHDVLPDLRELQLQAKRKAEATDMNVWPEIIVPSSVKLRRQPKSTVAASSVDTSGVKVPYEVPYQTIELLGADVQGIKQAIDDGTYASLFMAITNMNGIQPRNVEEIASRNDEKLTQLGPVIERVNNEKLEPAIDRTFDVMNSRGMLPDAPPAIANMDLKIEFVSILAQMQRMVGIGQIERTVSFIGNLSAVFPEAPDKLNTDEMIDEYADRAGAPQKIIRTEKEVEQIRAQRAQAKQMQTAAAMAQPAQQGADAARLLSETDTGDGQNMLQKMMGQ